ncbi:MAG: 30S ribosomal protein S12 methylthiotransferase RimO [Clostridia bacterium]
MNVGLVTLGCTKNQVDSEMILGVFKSQGFNIVNQVEEADIIVVNTCGFIQSAKEEAIDTILEMADYKQDRCKALIVTGCLAKRYKSQIIESMPEVDLVIGVDEYENLSEILSNFFSQSNLLNHYKFNQKLDFNNRIISSTYPLAYIRISDGCDNKCSYCAIPLIRGPFKSRQMEDILKEVEDLAKKGIKEFCIISQDTSKYGLDIYGELKLAELLNKMSKIEGVKWIRILYMYLFETTDELIEEIAQNNKVCNYFDIPIQHLNNKMLKDMNRHDTKEIIYDRIKRIRELVPDAILRTTCIVGFPGETEEQFEELVEGIKELKFDRLGAFTYSREEDTESYNFKGQIDENIKEERLKRLFDVQKKISLQKNKERLSKEYEVIVEDISEDEEYFVCRSMLEAPDVDGRIFIKIDEKSASKVIVGEYAKVKIIDYNDYDLFAEVL